MTYRYVLRILSAMRSNDMNSMGGMGGMGGGMGGMGGGMGGMGGGENVTEVSLTSQVVLQALHVRFL